MSQHANLTFGIELEFVCITDTAGFPNCRVGVDGLSHAGTAIFDSLREAGIPVTGYESDDEELGPVPEYSLWRVESDSCSLSRAELGACPAHCIVETVKLSSRKFHFYREDWRAEIQAVLDVLAHLEAKGARFITNHTTGMHVHVGLAGPEGEVPLRTAKNVMQLATAFERCFDQLHSIDRIAYPVRFETGWYHTPLSWWHQRNGKTAPESMLYDWLASIEDQQTYADLGSICTLSEALKHQSIREGTCLDAASGHNSTPQLRQPLRRRRLRPRHNRNDQHDRIPPAHRLSRLGRNLCMGAHSLPDGALQPLSRARGNARPLRPRHRHGLWPPRSPERDRLPSGHHRALRSLRRRSNPRLPPQTLHPPHPRLPFPASRLLQRRRNHTPRRPARQRLDYARQRLRVPHFRQCR
ncbi:hypothetical protein EJ03DRAFT_197378 [Teratosphaeria nubilosa]|uniref:Amidoligase enzyme n=1 Tax=Teratosphaeria nubilosa TaxID=161662 RepID=A0A6G1KYT1_9PEZI|nr:hypothetical protein EJ03DRAFT_197378 [Teratosphaeria nubilosa]